jgi:hypothetical protein
MAVDLYQRASLLLLEAGMNFMPSFFFFFFFFHIKKNSRVPRDWSAAECHIVETRRVSLSSPVYYHSSSLILSTLIRCTHFYLGS